MFLTIPIAMSRDHMITKMIQQAIEPNASTTRRCVTRLATLAGACFYATKALVSIALAALFGFGEAVRMHSNFSSCRRLKEESNKELAKSLFFLGNTLALGWHMSSPQIHSPQNQPVASPSIHSPGNQPVASTAVPQSHAVETTELSWILPKIENFTVNLAPEQLTKAPPLIVIEDISLPWASIDLDMLLTQFDNAFKEESDDANICTDEWLERSKSRARQSLQQGYLRLSSQSDIRSQATIALLKGIIFELQRVQNERLPADFANIQRTTFVELIRASQHCPPRRYTEVDKIWKRLSSQITTMEEQILEHVQTAKEELFMNYYSLSLEPVQTLNYIRRKVGEELGLNRHLINIQDPYIDLGGRNALSPQNRDDSHHTAEEFMGTFHQIYTPSNLVTSILISVNQGLSQNASFACELSQFIAQAITQYENNGQLSLNAMTQLPQPYQTESYQLTETGAIFLLTYFGHLVPNTPNGHLAELES